MFDALVRKVAFNIKCDRDLLTHPTVSWGERVGFTVRKYAAIALGKKQIRFLGRELVYDNRFAPVLLGKYPSEVTLFDSIVGFSKIRTVLDVGANIGQWTYALKHFFPNIHVYSFEPNKEVFPLLEQNAKSFRDWKVYNFALGEKNEKRTFYYSLSNSAEGSFYEGNVAQNFVRKDTKQIVVEVKRLSGRTRKGLRIPRVVDLVKIDVEGAELEVLRSLEEIKFKYLVIENSIRREGGGTLENIRKVLEREWGRKARLLYYDARDKGSPCGDAIFFVEG